MLIKKSDNYSILSIPLIENVLSGKVQESFKHMEEVVDDYLCLTCNKRGIDQLRTQEIRNFLKYLWIQIQRFNSELKKSSKEWIYEDRITIGEQVMVLTGLVVHQGNQMHGGHYISFVKKMNNNSRKFALG